MPGLLLFYVLLAFGLAVALWASALWLQSIIYSEPAEQLYWRAPAAAAALTLYLAFWGWLDYRRTGDFPGQFAFRASDTLGPFKELWAVYQGKEDKYTMRKNPQGQPEYRSGGKLLHGRPDAIVVEIDGEKVRFEPERDELGNFKVAKAEELRYLDPQGRVMKEGVWGRIPVSRGGLVFANLLLNLGHLVVWFLALWLLLRFQWPHALGLALACWLVMTFTAVGILMNRVEETARQRKSVASAWSSDEAVANFQPRVARGVSPAA